MANNKLYWRLRTDGTFTYEATLDPGNYSAITISTEIMNKMNEVGRVDVNKHQIYIKFTCSPVETI